MMVILPTGNVVNEFHQMACQIDMLDYDLDELIHIILEALIYPDNYPISFDQFVKLEEQHCAYTPDQYAQFNAILRYLYDNIYQALATAGLITDGALQMTYFCTYRGDILISEEEIPAQFERAPGVG